MQAITVIILTYNEEIHIKRCIDSIRPIAKDIFLVDSFSNDKTLEIAQSLGAKVFQNKWENNYAKQFNWALNNLPIQTKWVLRLDADEYLTLELVLELKEKLDNLPHDTTGVVIPLRRVFMNRQIKHGTGSIKLLRLFLYGKGHCEQRWMDEHIQLSEGNTIEFTHEFADHNLNTIAWWTAKHNGYSIREAIDLLDIELGLLNSSDSGIQLSPQAAAKRLKKYRYAKQPLFWRSFAYFIYRYIFKLGFTEGKEGFLWHFLQGWWYRTLVDAKIYEIKKACGTDKTKIRAYLKKEYAIEI
ncbi:MAG: glycosyltransferase family 2 protein [Prolixibacteraceae bacterium]|nr:glycosyltransferase family 2 protein [Prolixibacteraceae bacterium]